MPHFSYQAISRTGDAIQGRMEAASADAVVAALRAQGHYPVETRAVADTAGAGLLRGGSGRLGTSDLVVMTRELLLLLRAGQPLERCLAQLAGGLAPKPLRPRLAVVLDRVRGGSTLADGLERAGGFPQVYRAMVRAGESGGALEVALDQLVHLLERDRKLKETLTSALVYPAVLSLVAVGSILLMLLYVVPQFEHLFQDGAVADIPPSTRLVMGASQTLREVGWLLATGLAVLTLGLWALRDRLNLGPWWDRQVLALPLVGSLAAMTATSRLARTLSVLLKAGATLPTALALAAQAAGNRRFAMATEAMRAGVKDGRPLAASLPAGHPFPDLAVELMRVGEESGRLDEVLGHVADVYDQKVETGLKRLLSLIEPAFIILLGLLIGGIVVSILSALVSVNALAV